MYVECLQCLGLAGIEHGDWIVAAVEYFKRFAWCYVERRYFVFITDKACQCGASVEVEGCQIVTGEVGGFERRASVYLYLRDVVARQVEVLQRGEIFQRDVAA